MHKLPLFLLLNALAATIAAQDFSGTYSGMYNGDPVALVLTAAGQNVYTGTMNDSHLTYTIAATATGKNLKGTCSEQSLGLSMELTGILSGSTLAMGLNLLGTSITFDLQKTGAQNPTVARQPAAPADAQHDPALVGRWTHQSNYNSGYGQGSMSSENVMIFLADGRLADAGSRTVTSGSDWSGTSSDDGSGVIEGMRWYTRQQQLFLQTTTNGKTESQLLGRYYIENNNMLITGQDGTKVLFYKG